MNRPAVIILLVLVCLTSCTKQSNMDHAATALAQTRFELLRAGHKLHREVTTGNGEDLPIHRFREITMAARCVFAMQARLVAVAVGGGQYARLRNTDLRLVTDELLRSEEHIRERLKSEGYTVQDTDVSEDSIRQLLDERTLLSSDDWKTLKGIIEREVTPGAFGAFSQSISTYPFLKETEGPATR